MRIRGLVACLGFAVGAHAAEPIDCAAFSTAIEHAEKRLSMLAAELRHAAPAAKTNLQTRIDQELALLDVNIALLVTTACPLPSKPITVGAYSRAASECMLAEAREQDTAAACNQSKWQRDPP